MMGCGRVVSTPPSAVPAYTGERAMAVYAQDRERALQLVDSARIAGNLTAERAELLRATIFARTLDSPQYDSAIVISERLLSKETIKEDPSLRQDILELLVYSTRRLEDFNLQLEYCTQLDESYREQGEKTEALRTEAELGALLCRLGRAEEGLSKMDSVIRVLAPVRKFNDMDAGIIAMKRKIGVIGDAPLIAAEAQHILDCLEDYEQHPADFHDGSPREPDDEDRPGYIAYYRAQAWAFLAAAYANMGEPRKARHYLALTERSSYGQTLNGRNMMAPTLRQLGEYRKMEAILDEAEAVYQERGDTLTQAYARLLYDRAKAAQAQGRMTESTALWEKYARILQKADDRLLQGKANLYAARYHAQEQQMAIERQQAELSRKNSINTFLTIGVAVLLLVIFYILRGQRILRRKNSVLAREISDAIRYRDKYEALEASRQREELPPVALSAFTEEQLFRHIRDAVERDRLFLDPMLNRQVLCDRFSLSKEQLGAAFAKGSPYKSVTDFINDCRLSYATKLLTERLDLSISEVAEASGFARAATFTANFKKRFTLTPAQYRMHNLSPNIEVV
ncbi:MAG: helix-turn-helix domain-containing protein [Bacteroidales bacterium]|nr:helix-turn-helix domain-containing protein [Bacteroidales bacterium]